MPAVQHPPRRRHYLAILIASLILFCLSVVIANNFYEESPTPQHPRGQRILFHDPLPEIPGQILWLALFPLTFLTPLIILWSLYRYFRAATTPRANLCPTCAYDLRASQNCCPECGTPIPARPDN